VQPSTPGEAARVIAPPPANDARKPAAIVSIKRKSRFGDAPDLTPEELRDAARPPTRSGGNWCARDAARRWPWRGPWCSSRRRPNGLRGDVARQPAVVVSGSRDGGPEEEAPRLRPVAALGCALRQKTQPAPRRDADDIARIRGAWTCFDLSANHDSCCHVPGRQGVRVEGGRRTTFGRVVTTGFEDRRRRLQRDSIV
jgi:hypothetical protein